MTYEQYRMMFYIAFAACVILFLLTVILFFVLRIPKAFGDITGLSRKKAIKNINEQSEKAKASHESLNETDRISPSGRIISDYTGNTVITEKIETEQAAGGQETTVLSGHVGETAVQNDTKAGETTVLSGFGMGETTLLTENMLPAAETKPLDSPQSVSANGFAREIQSIVLIHADEIVA